MVNVTDTQTYSPHAMHVTTKDTYGPCADAGKCNRHVHTDCATYQDMLLESLMNSIKGTTVKDPGHMFSYMPN